MRRVVLAALLTAAAFANVPGAQAEKCFSHSLPTEPHKVCVLCDRVVCIYDLP